MARSLAITMVLCGSALLMARVGAECCYRGCCGDGSQKYDPYVDGWTCVYGSNCCDSGNKVVGSYCGVGSCNIFGCNCDGGCIKASSPPPASAATVARQLSTSAAESIPRNRKFTIRKFQAIDTDGDCRISSNETYAFMAKHYNVNLTALKSVLPVDFMKDAFKDYAGSLYARAQKLLPKHFDKDLANWNCEPKAK